MIQALLNTLRKQDFVTKAKKMFVTEPSKLFHVHYFFIAKLALYKVLNLCWRPKLFKFIWVLVLNVSFSIFKLLSLTGLQRGGYRREELFYMEETVPRIGAFLFYMIICGIANSNVALIHFTLADNLSFANKIL